MRTFCRSMMLSAALLASSLGAAQAQGIPVFDSSAIANQIQQLESMTQQFNKLQEQLEQAQKLHGSLNKLTDISSLGQILNDPKIRQALPKDFSKVEGLLKGTAEGDFQGMTDHFKSENTHYESSANSFYAQELKRSGKQSAGALSLGQSIYDAASKRMDGLETLKERIASATDAKEIMDLQARIQAESAFLQTDLLRMQGLKMVQDAQFQVAQQRQLEEHQKLMDAFGEALK